MARLTSNHVYLIIFLDIVIAYSTGFILLRDNFSGENNDVMTAFYWTIETMTTVGYGDIYPLNSVGEIYTIMVILSGIFLIFLFIPVILIPFIEERLQRLGSRGGTQYRCRQHFYDPVDP